MNLSQLLWATKENLKTLMRQRGFSLVQVMVAVGLMGGLALTMMKMMENQTKQQKTMELKAEQGDMANMMRQVLNNKVSCEATFLGFSPGNQINQIRINSDKSLPPFAETGVKFKNFNVYIKSMYILTRQEEVDWGQRQPGPPIEYNDPDGMGFGMAVLRVNFVKNIGAVNDANKSHQFFGAKETSIFFQVFGNFYDLEIVKHNDNGSGASPEEQVAQACYDRASTKGVTCTMASNERCWFEPLDVDKDGNIDSISDAATGDPLYLGECRYFRDDSPFMACSTSK